MKRAGMFALGIVGAVALGWLLLRSGPSDRPSSPSREETAVEASSSGVVSGSAETVSAPTSASARAAPEVQSEATPMARASGVSVRAIVIDGDAGVPLGGAEVSLRAEDGQPRAIAVSGPDGVVDLVAPSGERLIVYASAPTFAPCYGIEVPGVPGTVVDAGRLELVRGVPLRGRVLVDGSRPIAGAVVSILPRLASFVDIVTGQASALDVALSPSRFLDTTTSDARGQFVFPGVGPGSYFVVATAAGCARGMTAPFEVVEKGGAPFVTLTLQRGAPLAGRVVEHSGVPVPGARVALIPEQGEISDFGVPPEAVRTDAEGRYHLTLGERATGTILVRTVDGRMAAVPLAQGIGKDIVLAAREGGILEGRVYDRRSGRGISGVGLHLLTMPEEGRDIMGVAAASTDAEGRFRFESIPVGEQALLEVRAAGYALPPDPELPDDVRVRTSRIELEALTPGTTKRLDIALVGGGTLRGRVVDADTGKPLLGVRVGARTEGPVFPVSVAPNATTDHDGAFVLHPVQAGESSLWAHRRGYPDATFGTTGAAEPRSRIVVLGEGEERSGLEIRMQRGRSVSGAVVDAAGVPVAGAAIQAVIAGLDSATSVDGAFLAEASALRATSDEKGHFVLDGLAASALEITASHPDFPLGGAASLVASSGPPAEAVRVVVARGGTVRGLLREVGGGPARRAELSLRFRPTEGDLSVEALNATGSRAAWPRRSVTDDEGRFEFVGLPAGRWEFALENLSDSDPAGGPDGRRAGDPSRVLDDAVSAVEIRGEEVRELTLTLVPEHLVEGIVVDVQGRPIEGATVSFEGDAVEGNRGRVQTRSDAAGRFRIGGLRSGTGTVEVVAPSRDEDEPGSVRNPERTLRTVFPTDRERAFKKDVPAGTRDLRFVLTLPVRGG